MSLPSGLIFGELLNDDLYTTYLGILDGHQVVIKLFTEMSDNNNEYEILVYLQENSAHPEWFPVPKLKLTLSDGVIGLNPFLIAFGTCPESTMSIR
jgi:hypothetical protein